MGARARGAVATGTESDPDSERRLTIAEALREAIDEEMEQDERVIVLGEDLGGPAGWGGAFGVCQGLQTKFGEDRVIDTPISEKAILGAAIGATLMGMRPVADLQYSDFLFECMDEVVNEAAKLRYMSGGRMSVPLVVRCPVGATQQGAGSQHGQSPESYFCHVPGLKVVAPSDAYNAKGIMRSAIRDPDPVLVFEHKLLYGTKGKIHAGDMDVTEVVPTGEYVTPIGKAVVKRRGDDLTLVATHLMLYRSLVAADRLASEGMSVEVIDPISLRPFDTDAVIASVRRTGALVVVHEATVVGGWGAEVAASVTEQCFRSLRAPVRRVGALEAPLPAGPDLERGMVPSVEGIVTACREVGRR